MQSEILWASWQSPGLEQARVELTEDGGSADGVVLGIVDGKPFRLRYVVVWDREWRTRDVRVSRLAGPGWEVELAVDALGRWSAAEGLLPESLDGCVDVDIMATPFTNTLPIRRLVLGVGESAEIRVAYVSIPELTLSAEVQRYTRLPGAGRYRFESDGGRFIAEVEVDADGLVIDYPGLFRRVSVEPPDG